MASTSRFPFIEKLQKIVEDQSIQEIISWTPDHKSIKIHKPAEFSSQVLPKYWKHNSICSFVRQLNTYGFHKVVEKELIFQNDLFYKGNETNFYLITRRESKKRESNKNTLINPDTTQNTHESIPSAHPEKDKSSGNNNNLSLDDLQTLVNQNSSTPQVLSQPKAERKKTSKKQNKKKNTEHPNASALQELVDSQQLRIQQLEIENKRLLDIIEKQRQQLVLKDPTFNLAPFLSSLEETDPNHTQPYPSQISQKSPFVSFASHQTPILTPSTITQQSPLSQQLTPHNQSPETSDNANWKNNNNNNQNHEEPSQHTLTNSADLFSENNHLPQVKKDDLSPHFFFGNTNDFNFFQDSDAFRFDQNNDLFSTKF